MVVLQDFMSDARQSPAYGRFIQNDGFTFWHSTTPGF
jgi:hypothetical protein